MSTNSVSSASTTPVISNQADREAAATAMYNQAATYQQSATDNQTASQTDSGNVNKMKPWAFAANEQNKSTAADNAKSDKAQANSLINQANQLLASGSSSSTDSTGSSGTSNSGSNCNNGNSNSTTTTTTTTHEHLVAVETGHGYNV